ncbi:dihydrofolate reductase family protein [Allonocardiopsis opalescens]|uniref:dihydrofolate reductase family protein n=1 Tax=Allonocardiopsis opalescens TaxID=1144618 RepID=UPI000D057D28|nr:dihydrofolate reductase family protein [Allonocardiopsis opalescens]
MGESTAGPGGELQAHGGVDLVRWLLGERLLDGLILLVRPVVVGQGKRFFPEAGPDTALEPVKTRAFPKGIVLQVHRPTGRPEYAL